MKKIIDESLGAVTHTHTQAFYQERRKLIYSFFLWSKGGSRFETINGLLPRDLIG